MNYLRSTLFLLACLLVLGTLSAQNEVGLKMVVELEHKNKSYNQAKILIKKSGSPFDQVKTDESGKFIYTFDYGAEYLVEFTGEGMASKALLVDLTSVPEYETNHLIDWTIGTLTLYKAYDKVDVSALSKPVGRIFYDPDLGDFSIDYDYGRKREKELDKVEEQLESAEKAEIIAFKATEDKYGDLIKEGDKYFKAQDYDKAMTFYTSARNLIPEYPKAKEKLAEANKLVERDARYKDLVLEADGYFRAGEWAQAKDAYQLASSMKPAESYPKSQLSVLIEKQKQQEMRANQFNNHMTVADAAMKLENYVAAAESYQKALALNPDAVLPKKKLAAAKAKLSEAEKAEENRKQEYLEIIAGARLFIDSQSFKEAESAITMAAKMYPNDSELGEVRRELSEAKKSYDAQQLVLKKEQEKQNQFESYKKRAQEYDQQGNVSSALYFYRRANDVIPNDPFIQSRIRALQSGQSLAKADAKPEATESETKEAATKPKSEFSELDEMDKSGEGFATLLASKFPQGKTQKTYKEGNKDVTRCIIVEGNRGVEYQKIKHSWGGVYYFKNGEPITEYIWQKETRK